MTFVKQSNPRIINELFDEVYNHFPSTWGRDGNSYKAIAAVNIFETSNAFNLELNAAGLKKENFKVKTENDVLTISYEKKEDSEKVEGKTIRKEFSHQNFKRSFGLDKKINTENITAKYEDGILKVNLPKKDEIKVSPKEINIE